MIPPLIPILPLDPVTFNVYFFNILIFFSGIYIYDHITEMPVPKNDASVVLLNFGFLERKDHQTLIFVPWVPNSIMFDEQNETTEDAT